jgi:hypothetical protein
MEKNSQAIMKNGGKLADGGSIPQGKDPHQQAIEAAKTSMDFFNHYLKSPLYQQRLKTQGYQNTKDVVQKRLSRNNFGELVTGEGIGGSSYLQDGKTIAVDLQELKQNNFSLDGTVYHEFAHKVGNNSYTNINHEGLNTNEIEQFNTRNKAFKTWPEHDSRAWEAKSDMDALRISLYKDKIYDAGKSEFTPELLKKAKSKYKTSEFKRLFANFADKDLIYLMNNIAQHDTGEGVPVAENGITIGDPEDPYIKKYGQYVKGRSAWLDWTNKKLGDSTVKDLATNAAAPYKMNPGLLYASAMEEG